VEGTGLDGKGTEAGCRQVHITRGGGGRGGRVWGIYSSSMDSFSLRSSLLSSHSSSPASPMASKQVISPSPSAPCPQRSTWRIASI
jgi:hypothetical protein